MRGSRLRAERGRRTGGTEICNFLERHVFLSVCVCLCSAPVASVELLFGMVVFDPSPPPPRRNTHCCTAVQANALCHMNTIFCGSRCNFCTVPFRCAAPAAVLL